jgi:hypothetical protein
MAVIAPQDWGGPIPPADPPLSPQHRRALRGVLGTATVLGLILYGTMITLEHGWREVLTDLSALVLAPLVALTFSLLFILIRASIRMLTRLWRRPAQPNT